MLTGCAPSPASRSTPETSSRTPVATVSPAALKAPEFAFDIGCGGLLTTAELQSDLTAPIHEVADETTTRVNDLAVAQAGGITCVWGGADRTDGGYDDGMTLTILPDASADEAASASDAGQCVSSNGYCFVDGLVGSSWVSLRVTAAHGTPSPLEQEGPALLGLVGSRLAAAKSVAARWTAPTGALASLPDCAARSGAAARAIGVEASNLSKAQRFDTDGTDIGQVARRRSGWGGCSWSGTDGSPAISWGVLPGAGWAFGVDRSDPRVALHPAMVPGADAAWIGCADGCVAIVEVRHSLAEVGLDSGLDDATVVQRAAAAIAAFAS
jgi:hypothetical protein